MDREKVKYDIERCICHVPDACRDCSHYKHGEYLDCMEELLKDALALLKEHDKEIKALRLLVEWATDCDFGFEQFRDEYELYKNEIEGMKYIDAMIHVAKRTLEDHGAFETKENNNAIHP